MIKKDIVYILALPFLAFNAWYLPRAMIVAIASLQHFEASLSIVISVVVNLFCYFKVVGYLIGRVRNNKVH